MKLYSLDNKFLKKTNEIPANFTGIVEYSGGTKEWYKNCLLHRIDGPACEWVDGSREWFFNNERHRLDGPAWENPDGAKSWHVGGKKVTEFECKLLYDIMKLKGLL